jgi:hypothetical protein
MHRWAQAKGIPIRYFAKNDKKERIAEPLLRAASGAAPTLRKNLSSGCSAFRDSQSV